ncbi:MAG: hypothetical protein O3C54_06185 [Proteobacteria bacterium]|nr:hypothetical protein [Pseudomonadota bacterium]
MNQLANYTLIWNSYLDRINLSHQSDIYQYCYNNTDTALDILDRFDQSYPPLLDIGPGWMPIIFPLHNKILSLVNDYKIYQIKEKFGGLRFYGYPIVLDFYNPQSKYHVNQIYNHLVQSAEEQSFNTCQVCSASAKVHKINNRYITLCSTCVKSYQ